MVLSILQEILSFIQIIALGFYSTTEGIWHGSPYTRFLATIFDAAMNLGDLFNDLKSGHVYMMIVYMFILALWVIFFVIFAIRYKQSKTFSAVVIKFIYYIGYHVFNLDRVVCATTVGFFTRALVTGDYGEVNPVLCLFSIVFLVGYYVISVFVMRALQSSPDVDIKNKMSHWPQDFTPRWYRMSIGYALPFLLELVRGWSDLAEYVMMGVTIVAGVIGMVVIWHKDTNVFPIGRVVISLEYTVLILGPLLTILYRLLGGSSLWYLLVFVVVLVLTGILLNMLVSWLTKVRIDLLYSKFENLTANITTPKQCIKLFKTGIVFNVPCITNHTILNWAIARWPNDQPLLLMIAFIFYVMHVPYSDILELVVVAVDISPFSVYDTLLFAQIFNRLPTREHHLTKRLDGIRRLYDLPKSSLKAFWEAVLTHQWDEAVNKCRTFRRDIDYINQIFSNLIFENPASDCVMQEFIKFAMEVQGNHAVARAAQKELNRRQPIEEAQTNQGEDGSVAQMSQLSSVKSSIFFSEFSEAEDNFGEVHHAIQSSVQARPVFFPQRVLFASILTALISLVLVVVVFVFATEESQGLDEQVEFASYLYKLSNYLTDMFCAGMEFSTHSEAPNETVSGEEFNYSYWRVILNGLSRDFDTVLADCFSLHPALPQSYLRLWITKEVNALMLAPVVGKNSNLTLMTAIRIFQIRARTLAFSPENYLGTIDDPCPEVLSLTYLYPAASEVTAIMMNELTTIVRDQMQGKTNLLLITTLIGMSINTVLVFLVIPIICFGMFKETDFILTIYGCTPVKIVKTILGGDNEVDVDDMTYDQMRNQKQGRLLPSSMYQIWEVVILFFAILLITPIPAYVSYFSYKDHSNNCFFVLNGLALASNMLSEMGLLFLHSFRAVSGFASPLTSEQELQAFEVAATKFKEHYNTLLFGQTKLFPHGLNSYDFDLSGAFNDCPSLLGDGEINHTCSSFHSDIYYLYGLCLRLANINNSIGMGLGSDWWRLFYPVIENSLSLSFAKLYERFVEISQAQRARNNDNNLLAIIAGVCLFILAVIAAVVLVKIRLAPNWRGFLSPILVMDPKSIADCPFLMRFLQGDYDNPSRKISGDGKHRNTQTTIPMIDFILEGVLVMTADGIVVASNRKYHELMASLPEDTMGTNVRELLPSSCAPVFEAMDTIRNGGSSPQGVSIETSIFSDDDRELQVKISFIAQLSQHETGNRNTLCAVILTDRSDVTNKQAMLKREKANVEQNLNRLLPPPIAKSFMNGQTDISFQVPEACVLDANIVSFTPMCMGMSAKAVINTINGIFNEFDTQLPKYPRVTKVKTIGDSYLCVAGIFDADGSIQDAACDLVSLAFVMQDLVVSLNAQHNTSIHLRIGVHAGGPVMCGIVGRDNPIFEVFGPPLSFIEQLQATCPHDAIQVSQALANHITSMNLKLTDRGNEARVESQRTFVISR